MPASGDGDHSSAARPHVVLLPSAGMGHLVPFGRLACALSEGRHGCDVSLATTLPTVSSAESRHLAALFAVAPAVRRLDFRLAPFDESEFPGADPFFLRFEATRRSAPLLLGPLLDAAAASALVTDIALASVVLPVARARRVPCYVLFTSSAAMLAFSARFPAYLDANATAGAVVGDVDVVPGVYRVPRSSVPQALHDPRHLFTQQFVANSRGLVAADGILVNTFDAFEPDAVAALRRGAVVADFPPVFTVGPLLPVRFHAAAEAETASYMAWLAAQPARSVVYVSFGSRKAISTDQIRELAAGLEASGERFLWVVKSTVVDRDEDAADDLGELLGGDGFLERVRGRAFVTKGWVEQEEVLRHGSVGAFLSHCGWNSVTEAAAFGVPVLAWPRFGDQRVNAAVVARAGLGAWEEERWTWDGEQGLVSGEEVAEKIKAVMGSDVVAKKAAMVGDAAAAAAAEGGTSYQGLEDLVGRCRDAGRKTICT